MDTVRKLASSVDFDKPYDVDVHRKIYDQIHALTLERSTGGPEESDARTLPPWLVLYTARNILSPRFVLGQIPHLLDLLALLETCRRFAVLKSDDALAWQTFYERENAQRRANDGGGGVRLLSTDEVYTLKRFVAGKSAHRGEYVALIRSLILLYVHYVCTAPESCLLPKRLNDFFPGSIKGFDEPSELIFHVDLSEDERAYFDRLKVDCQEWLILVTDWDSQREKTMQRGMTVQKDVDASYADEFLEAFPRPSSPSEMARNVETYMAKVENMVRTLEEWFPPSLANDVGEPGECEDSMMS